MTGTSRRNLLVLLLADGSEEQLRRAVAERSDQLRAVHVVAPARVGALEWLATDEDDARRQAHVHALAAEWKLANQAQVEGEAGDVDPVQAVEDALREFPADEILIVGGPSEDGPTFVPAGPGAKTTEARDRNLSNQNERGMEGSVVVGA